MTGGGQVRLSAAVAAGMTVLAGALLPQTTQAGGMAEPIVQVSMNAYLSDLCQRRSFTQAELQRMKRGANFGDILEYALENCPELAALLADSATATIGFGGDERDDRSGRGNGGGDNGGGSDDGAGDGDSDDGSDDGDGGSGDGGTEVPRDGDGKGPGKRVDGPGKRVDGPGKRVDGPGKRVDGPGKRTDGPGRRSDGNPGGTESNQNGGK